MSFSRAAIFGALLMLSACQPLYGGKPESLKRLETKKRPPQEATKVAAVVYNEDCATSFFDPPPPRAPAPSPGQAQGSVQTGRQSIDQARRAPDAPSKVNSIIAAIESYKAALVKDPYNAEATFYLAEAYDMVLRKGCAIALLKRLAALQTHTAPVDERARSKINELMDNPSMFAGYRKDAVTAVGR
jgi:hypothetical protein